MPVISMMESYISQNKLTNTHLMIFCSFEFFQKNKGLDT